MFIFKNLILVFPLGYAMFSRKKKPTAEEENDVIVLDYNHHLYFQTNWL